jgi:NAD-dependent histone deacetylase SIR2
MSKRPLEDPEQQDQQKIAKPTKINGEWVLPTITKQQASEAKRFLKEEGMVAFLERYLPENPRGTDIVYVTTLLGFFPFSTMDDIDDERNLMKAIKMLQKAMNKVIQTRSRMDMTLDEALRYIQDAENIIVLTGAGISTSLGIPDFRSAKGIYTLVEDLGLDDPQQVFDLSTFHDDPDIFYKVAHMILPPEGRWTPTHSFIKALSDKGKLLRNYTQNIDNLEHAAGIPKDEYIQCHGSFATATCRTCGRQVEGSKIYHIIRAQQLPVCPKCHANRKAKLKNSDSVGDYGIMKPDITFFGEDLPQRFYDHLKQDIEKCGLLICIGTSLKVAPVNNIVNLIAEKIPQILINKDDLSHVEFDVSVLGYCDEVVSYLTRRLGWDLGHKGYDDTIQIREKNPEVGIYECFKDESSNE